MTDIDVYIFVGLSPLPKSVLILLTYLFSCLSQKPCESSLILVFLSYSTSESPGICAENPYLITYYHFLSCPLGSKPLLASWSLFLLLPLISPQAVLNTAARVILLIKSNYITLFAQNFPVVYHLKIFNVAYKVLYLPSFWSHLLPALAIWNSLSFEYVWHNSSTRPLHLLFLFF